ncbi:uncharacterized protein VP01_1537g4 [Puccinia sorghi]|uniref:Uncharacterized protein n=1 Tax=Puccinia sorghi TaxID=27349 RepID=A0A0L6VKA4_9BASI|nr:uncharacterized protein VP01_1537g4 [Puccinia sorghi]
MVLAPEKAPKDITSNIDPANILQSRRRANVAILTDPRQLGDEPGDIKSGPVAFIAEEVPQTYNQAMSSGERVKWREAIEQELAAMADLAVWEVV